MLTIFVWTTLLAPLIGFLCNSFCQWNRWIASAIGCLSSFISFVSAICLFVLFPSSVSTKTISLFSWLQIDQLDVSFSALLDSLSLVMILIITGVGFLIHVFSVEYMKDDSRIGRYFSYLNLFMFNMLILVLADNLLVLFVGWEGVGLCSYLLIGFWFHKIEKARAGMKAFIVNRIGDAAFLIGLFLYFTLFQSLDFLSFNPTIAKNSSFVTLATCLFLFLGATGKSAQFPLYVWLPSAMAGPTPVSALIHAATMVTAGIYLILRMYEMWSLSEIALNVVAMIGVLTAIIGAIGACRVWDVKKILAYSTISQLGYMFLALGVKAFPSALFHLITHAFFKAGLFLAAGSLIHSLNGEQDIRKMGGLAKKIPITFFSFLIGGLALMGVPPLSGFFSKDEILYYTFKNSHPTLWLLGVLGAMLTAFYTTKMIYSIFFKKPPHSFHSIHEGGLLTKAPLCTLSILGIGAGLLNWPHFLPKVLSHQWLANFTSFLPHPSVHHISLEILLAVISVVAVLATITASLFYLIKDKKILIVKKLLDSKVSLDAFYHQYLVQPTKALSHELLDHVEISILQKGIICLAQFFTFLRRALVSLQNGFLGQYLLFLVFGFVVFIFITLFR